MKLCYILIEQNIWFKGNILTFAQGTNMGWFSPALPVLINDPSPMLDGPISQETAGWIGSFLAVGGLCGCIGFGLLSNWIGYKRTMQLSAFPLMVYSYYQEDDFIIFCKIKIVPLTNRFRGYWSYSVTIRGRLSSLDFSAELQQELL